MTVKNDTVQFLKKVDWKKVGIAAVASVATHVTRNISNQVVRQVAKVGIEAGVETVIDTGLDVAAGNKVSGQTLAMNFGYNLFTNGLGSVSTKRAPKSDVTKTKPMTGEVLDAGYVHNRPVKDVTPTKSSSQKLIGGPRADTPRLEATKGRPTWKQSEIDVGSDYPGYYSQKSFLHGKEVSYSTRGSVRPEYYVPGHSVEVKNYNLESKSGKYNLVNNVSKQVLQRNVNLPLGTRQTIIIDIRGQNVTDDVLEYVNNSIRDKTGTDVEIKFRGE